MYVKHVKFLVKASEISLRGTDLSRRRPFLYFTSFLYPAAWNADMMARVSAAIMDHGMISFDEDLD